LNSTFGLHSINRRITARHEAFKTMNHPASRFRPAPAVFALLALSLAGCAATINQDGVEQRTSMAIGRPVGSFTIANQAEGTGGRLDYSVKTKEGATYKCYMYSATAFQKVMSFGQTPHSDAVCSAMGAGTPPAACNALNKAAGKC
jgi:hypothetical protein